MKLTIIITPFLMARPTRRQFFTLAKIPIPVWQTQFWVKRIVKGQGRSDSDLEPWTLGARDRLGFQDNVTFGHQPSVK
jgi:hypothetical protein